MVKWNGTKQWHDVTVDHERRLSPGAHVSVSHPPPGGRSRAHRQCEKVSRSKVYNRRSNNSRSSVHAVQASSITRNRRRSITTLIDQSDFRPEAHPPPVLKA